MNKRKLVLICVSVILAFSFNTIYTSNVIYWDAYALEIDLTDSVEPENFFSISRVNLYDYPLVLSVIDDVNDNGYTVVTFDDGGTLPQFLDLVEENDGSLDFGYTYLVVDESDYMLSKISYGGMDDEPVYLYISWLMSFLAVMLILSELVAYLRSR